MYLKPKYYLAIAGAVAFAIWAVMGVPLPSHPDFASYAKGLSPVRRHLLTLLAVLCTVVLGFQVYVVRYASKHDDGTRAWLPGICARSTVLRSICTDMVLLAVGFGILTDKTFPIDTPAARERVKKFQEMPGHKSAD